MIQKILIITISLILYANAAFCWTTSSVTINSIQYDNKNVEINFTDSSGWTATREVIVDNESDLRIMVAILLTAITNNKQCYLEIVGGVVVRVQLLK